MNFHDPERERKRKLQAERRRKYPWVQWYRTDRWRSARRDFLGLHPYCEICAEPATVVDHVEPHRGNPQLFWLESNWRALCKHCHDRKTVKRDGGFGNAPGEDVSAACGEDGVPSDPRHPWNRG